MNTNQSASNGGKKQVGGETELRHRFLLKREYINIRILDRFAHPITDTACKIDYDDGMKVESMTDERGWLHVLISDTAEYADIKLEGVEEYALRRVQLIPMRTQRPDVSEVKQRLANIGFPVESDLRKGILEFQEEFDLELTGEADPEFKEKLNEIYERYRTEDGETEDESYNASEEDDDGDDLDEEEGRT